MTSRLANRSRFVERSNPQPDWPESSATQANFSYDDYNDLNGGGLGVLLLANRITTLTRDNPRLAPDPDLSFVCGDDHDHDHDHDYDLKPIKAPSTSNSRRTERFTYPLEAAIYLRQPCTGPRPFEAPE